MGWYPAVHNFQCTVMEKTNRRLPYNLIILPNTLFVQPMRNHGLVNY